MTSSTLLTHGKYLNDHDLQVLRDYALEAPFEWRMALEQLIEAAHRDRDVEKFEADNENLRIIMKDSAREIEEAIVDFTQTIANAKTNEDVQRGIEKLKTVVEETTKEMKEAAAAPIKPKG